jgi:hypothetical protein
MRSELPQDLTPLPTAPYSERPDSLPLDIEECRTALWMYRGNVSSAAQRLKVTPSRLRSFIKKSPYLTNEMDEARQQLQDIAEDVVYEALTDDEDVGRRDTMARFVLTNLGGERGYGSKPSNMTINNSKGGTIVVGWADGSSFNDNDGPKTIEGVVNE